MALTPEQELAEHEWRMDQMAVNIEKMRADMAWETKKFVWQAVVAAAILLGAGGTIGGVVVNYAKDQAARSASAPALASPAR